MVVPGAVIVIQTKQVFVEEFLSNVHTGAILFSLCSVLGVLNRPWQWAVERVEEHGKSPGNNNVVVEHDNIASYAGSNTKTVESWVKGVPDVHITLLHDLANSEFKAKEWHSQKHQTEDIRDEVSGATVLVAQIWESP